MLSCELDYRDRCTLFSRNIGALKYGILGFTDSQTISPSHACMKDPNSVSSQYDISLAEIEYTVVPRTCAGGPVEA
jgi:hypothetical protein